mmetsp:Transcript_29199/g.69525  ORF Transcript_29199/g.69525 Transcript_29199/m.69525 type:complete len:304 (-) Transcript_29199:179-1090(-)
MTTNCDNKQINAVKIGAICFTLFIGLTTTFYAVKRAKSSVAFVLAGIYAAGQFIGVACLHLGWASDLALMHFVTDKYPVGPLICVISILVTQMASAQAKEEESAQTRTKESPADDEATMRDSLLMSQSISMPEENAKRSDEHTFGMTFVVVMVVHSVFGGLVIGLQTTLHMTVINLIAFGVHKGVAGYALGLDLKKWDIEFKKIASCCIVFACSTPLGVGIGMGVLASANMKVGHIIAASFAAIAAGSFLYIAVTELNEEYRARRVGKLSVLVTAFLGVSVMSVIFPVILFPGNTTHEIMCLS